MISYLPVVIVFPLLILLHTHVSAQPAPFPLVEGEAVVTCGANERLPNGANQFVCGVIDVRNPPAERAGLNWAAPMYHGPGDSWTLQNLGQVFGVTVDTSGNIYVTASTVYGIDVTGPGGEGGVYKLDGRTGTISVLAQLPNSGPGLGNICFDPAFKQLLVTNHEDGRIYRLAADGTLLGTFDPMERDLGEPGFAPLGERLWGVAVYGNRVYYAVWQAHGARNPTARTTIRSVALDNTGAFVPASDRLEITIPPLILSRGDVYVEPVADIAFSIRGHMLLAERSMAQDGNSNAHYSRVIQYTGVPGNWGTPLFHLLGNYAYTDAAQEHTNSAGGVDFGYARYDASSDRVLGCDDAIWGTGDALRFNGYNPDGGRGRVYGMARIPVLPNTKATLPSTSYYVDFDGDTMTSSKTRIGCVEIFRRCDMTSIQFTTLHLCIGDTVHLTAREGASYTWLPLSGLDCYDCRSPRATPASSTTYRVEITTSTGDLLVDEITVLVDAVMPPARIVVGNEQQITSTILQVPIDLLDPLDVAGVDRLSFTISYDPTFMRPDPDIFAHPENVVQGTLLSGWNVAVSQSGPGELTVECSAPAAGVHVNGTGTLLALPFTPFLTEADRTVVTPSMIVPGRRCVQITSQPDTVVSQICGRLYRLIEIMPEDFALDDNIPNPFNPLTTIAFSLGLEGHATLEIIDVTGKLAAILVDEHLEVGQYRITWDASAFPSGLYYYRLRTETWSRAKSMMLMK